MKKQKKKAYLQDWGTYSNQTVVSVGMNFQDMLNYLHKIKSKFSIAENFVKNKENIDLRLGDQVGGLAHIDHQNSTSIIMFLTWKNDWPNWDSLNHEIAHVVHGILGKDKNMMDEDEARAYQHEYLFKEIRRKLWKLYP